MERLKDKYLMSPFVARTSMAVFLLVNILFVIKYASRISVPVAVGGVAAYLLIVAACFYVSGRIRRPVILVGILAYSAGMLFVASMVPMETLNVDRWEVITAFWNAVENGEYPYFAHACNSGNPPGPSPVYFFLSYPFYKTGLFQCMALMALWLWVLFVPSRAFVSNRHRALTILLFMCSPVLAYEIVTRSTILFNAVIFFIWAVYFVRFPLWHPVAVIGNALLLGFILATRSAYVVPVLVFGFYYLSSRWREDRVKIVLWGLVAFAAYASVFGLLVLIWGLDSFLTCNPFMVQSEMIIPMWLACLLLGMSVAAGLVSRTPVMAIWLSGIILFVSGLSQIVLVSVLNGFHNAFVESHADITYMLLGLPFLLYFINARCLAGRE